MTEIRFRLRQLQLAVTALAAFLLASLAPGAAQAAKPAFQEELVSFVTHDGLTLEGILSYPAKGSGPFPALLLIPGRGVRDADVTVEHPLLTRGQQKLFQRTARYFSARGFVVLRYNKRGASFDRVADQPDLLWNSTFSDLVADSRVALATLVGHPLAAASPVVVYGHSEGTQVAAHLALDAVVDLVILVGSANDIEAVVRFQWADRYVTFMREAADGDRDGFITLDELDRLDGRSGLGSFFVSDVREILFDLTELASGEIQVHGFNADLDSNGDGRLDVESEVVVGFERRLEDLWATVAAGEANAFDTSFLRLRPMTRLLRSIDSAFLITHGDLDAFNHLSEAQAIADKLERLGRSDYRLLRFPRLGHSLSRSTDYFKEDGGLTILDNPTLNSPSKRTLRTLRRNMNELLEEQREGD